MSSQSDKMIKRRAIVNPAGFLTVPHVIPAPPLPSPAPSPTNADQCIVIIVMIIVLAENTWKFPVDDP